MPEQTTPRCAPSPRGWCRSRLRDAKKSGSPRAPYYYQGLWDFIDHILISRSLQSHCSQRITVGRFPFLLTEEGTPYRTYRGPAYVGGVSDHLPIWADLFIR